MLRKPNGTRPPNVSCNKGGHSVRQKTFALTMDFNDIKSRLERAKVSLNTRFDEDFKKHTNIKFVDTVGGKGVALTFGKDSKTEVEYKITSILHGLATLKDHLKNCLTNNGHQAKLVEDEVNASLHLQVLVDLVNADKHKYPTTSNRSGKNPVIKNAEQALAMGGGNAGDVTEINIGNDGHLIVHGVPPKITITADICDEHGNVLFNLNQLVDTCYSKWETLAKTYNCVP